MPEILRGIFADRFGDLVQGGVQGFLLVLLVVRGDRREDEVFDEVVLADELQDVRSGHFRSEGGWISDKSSEQRSEVTTTIRFESVCQYNVKRTDVSDISHQ